MDLERLHPGDDPASVRACHDIAVAAAREDNPRVPPITLPAFRAWLTYGWTEEPPQTWLARDGSGQVCGWCLVTLPERENRHRAGLNPVVHPERRRAGLGTLLVACAADRARDAGRTLLSGHTDDASAGEGFARALGARQRMTEVRRVLRLDSVPRGHLAALREQAALAAPGYSLVTWSGPTAADRVAAVAALYAGVNDAPRDAGEQEQYWTADRIRMLDERVAGQGLHFYTVAARHEPGGDLVALTRIGVDPLEPGWGFQELTVVAATHRGHRLGMLVKVAMLDLLAEREPRLANIVTETADSNEHMIAINAALGFEVLDRMLSWECDTAQAPAIAELTGPAS